MISAQTRLASWQAAALLLCLLLGMLAQSGPAFAHAGHRHGAVKVTKAIDIELPAPMDTAIPRVAAMPVDVSATDHAVLVEATPVETAAPDALIQPNNQGTVAAAITHVWAAPTDTDRSTSPCGTGCSSCSSASCCVGAVVPIGFELVFPVTRLAVEMTPQRSARGVYGDPLPRPPNPVRLS
jgi:hypothetical protein